MGCAQVSSASCLERMQWCMLNRADSSCASYTRLHKAAINNFKQSAIIFIHARYNAQYSNHALLLLSKQLTATPCILSSLQCLQFFLKHACTIASASAPTAARNMFESTKQVTRPNHTNYSGNIHDVLSSHRCWQLPLSLLAPLVLLELGCYCRYET